MKISQIISEMATCAGSVASVAKPLGEVEKRPSVGGLEPAEKVMKGKSKKKGPYANSLSEGAVKQLSMDLKGGPDGLNDAEFKKKYGKTKQEVRAEMKKQPQKQEPVKEARLEEEDKIIAPGKGHKLKTGLHGKDKKATMLSTFLPPFKAQGIWVSDRRGNSVLEVVQHGTLAAEVAAALNAFVATNESVEGVAEDKGMTQYNAFKREWRAKHGSDAKVPGYDSKEYTSYVYRHNDKKQGVGEGAKVDRMVKHIEKSEKKLGHSKKEAENIAWATANKRGMLDNKNKKAK